MSLNRLLPLLAVTGFVGCGAEKRDKLAPREPAPEESPEQEAPAPVATSARPSPLASELRALRTDAKRCAKIIEYVAKRVVKPLGRKATVRAGDCNVQLQDVYSREYHLDLQISEGPSESLEHFLRVRHSDFSQSVWAQICWKEEHGFDCHLDADSPDPLAKMPRAGKALFELIEALRDVPALQFEAQTVQAAILRYAETNGLPLGVSEDVVVKFTAGMPYVNEGGVEQRDVNLLAVSRFPFMGCADLVCLREKSIVLGWNVHNEVALSVLGSSESHVLTTPSPDKLGLVESFK